MLKGGLIHKISQKQLSLSRSKKSIPELAYNLVDYLRFKNNEFITRNESSIYGSFSYRLQSYPGDIDSTNFIYYSIGEDVACKDIVNQLQSLVKKLLHNKLDRHFSDLKCGTYDNGESIHWRASEILKGYRSPNIDDINGFSSNKIISLYDAVSEKGAMIKLDMLAKYIDRYIEVSCLYQIKTDDGNLSRQMDSNIDSFLDDLIKDTSKQLKNGKLFKVVKRIFSNAKIRNDTKTLKIIEPLINSNLSKLDSLKADLNTLKLLLSVNKYPDNEVLKNQLDKFKFSFDNILDIKLPYELIYKKIDKLYIDIKDKKKDASIDMINDIITTLNDVINAETMSYLKSINRKDFFSFGKKYLI